MTVVVGAVVAAVVARVVTVLTVETVVVGTLLVVATVVVGTVVVATVVVGTEVLTEVAGTVDATEEVTPNSGIWPLNIDVQRLYSQSIAKSHVGSADGVCAERSSTIQLASGSDTAAQAAAEFAAVQLFAYWVKVARGEGMVGNGGVLLAPPPVQRSHLQMEPFQTH